MQIAGAAKHLAQQIHMAVYGGGDEGQQSMGRKLVKGTWRLDPHNDCSVFIKENRPLENAGIDPATSRMLSERSTI